MSKINSFNPKNTEGIKYMGSKLKLLPYIAELSKKIQANKIFDAFSGSTRVSQMFAQLGYQVISNDLAIWSKIFGQCYLLNKKNPHEYKELIEYLNNLTPKTSWFTKKYGGYPNHGISIQEDGLKKPWQIHNTRKLDAIREEIEYLNLSDIDKSIALTSLILALDEVDNTLGHHASYLRKWSPRSYKNMILKVPNLFISSQENTVLCDDIFNLTSNISVDLTYLDPPYGSNNAKMPSSRVRYAPYYHLWKTICLFDNPNTFGKAKRREDTSFNLPGYVFEDYKRNENGNFLALEAIEKLIINIQTKWIILSYSSGGRATANELNSVLKENCNLLEVLEIDYKKNIMSNMKWTNEWLRDTEKPNKEFLFLLEK